MLAAPASLVGSSLAGSDGAPPSAVAAAAPAAAVLATPASLVGSSLAGSDAVSATPAPGSAISYVSHGGTILSSSHVSTDSCGRLAPAAAARASHARSLEAMTCAVAELARAPLDASPPVGRDDAQTGAAPAARAGTARVPTDLQPVPTTPFTGGQCPDAAVHFLQAHFRGYGARRLLASARSAATRITAATLRISAAARARRLREPDWLLEAARQLEAVADASPALDSVASPTPGTAASPTLGSARLASPAFRSPCRFSGLDPGLDLGPPDSAKLRQAPPEKSSPNPVVYGK